MTPFELRCLVDTALNQGHEHLILTTHRATEPRGQWVRLFGREGPRGRFVGADRVSGDTVRVIGDYPIAGLLKWLARLTPQS